MPRISGVELPNEKRIAVALSYIYGVGPNNALAILKEAGINPDMRAKNLSEDEVSRIAGVIDRSFVVEGQLRRQIQQNVQRLKDIQCYRGSRHRRGLPVRGQRTRTNARTRKGPKKTVAGKKGVKELRH
ncbi:MAG: 30S ribosomal protein S13 [Phycisphaerae bacterium]